MIYSGVTLETVYAYHSPNEGRDIWNRNFNQIQDSVHFFITGSTSANTVVNGSSNITVLSSGITIPPIYTTYLNDDLILNSISSSFISANTFYVGAEPVSPTFLYNFYSDLPPFGEDDYIYGAKDTNSLYTWDSDTEQYISFNSINTNDLWSSSTGSNSIIANNGSENLASGYYSFAGGYQNSATTNYSLVVGGKGSLVSGYNSTVVGGYTHIVSGEFSFIGNGVANLVQGNCAFIGAGALNSASEYYSLIVGGKNNSALAQNSSIVGGYKNSALAQYSFVGNGYKNSALGQYSSVVGGRENYVSGKYSSILGGRSNLASSKYSSIVGGFSNSATTYYSSIVGGRGNNSYGLMSFIGGGFQNSAGNYSSIVGGFQNSASGIYSSILGGRNNISTGQSSSILGGIDNVITGDFSSIAGGSGMTNSFDSTFMTINARLAENGGVVYSAGTDFYDIFESQTTVSNGLTKTSNNIVLGGIINQDTTLELNNNHLTFLNQNPTSNSGDYKFMFLDGVAIPTNTSENISHYIEFKPIVTSGNFQVASAALMYANPSGITGSEFFGGVDAALITTDLDVFQDSVSASLSLVELASSAGNFSGGFINSHISVFRNVLSGNTVENMALYHAYGVNNTSQSIIENLYGFYMRNSLDTNIINKWGIYIDDASASNYFAGDVNISGNSTANKIQLTSNSEAQLIIPSINIISAPDGSMWFTTTGDTTVLNYQVSGITKSVELT